VAVLEGEGDVGAVEPDGCDTMAGDDAGNDVHPAPALFGKALERRVDPSPRDHLGAAAPEVGVASSMSVMHSPIGSRRWHLCWSEPAWFLPSRTFAKSGDQRGVAFSNLVCEDAISFFRKPPSKKPKMELYQLRTFAAVAELGSLTQAAERLHLSQPAASAQIKLLEEEFGLALFERKPSGLTLTRAGTELLPGIQTLLASAGQVLTHASVSRAT